MIWSRSEPADPFAGWPVKGKAIVHLIDAESIRGIVWEIDEHHLILRNAELLANDGTAKQIDGEVLVERHRVNFVQVLPA